MPRLLVQQEVKVVGYTRDRGILEDYTIQERSRSVGLDPRPSSSYS